jgi:hypothetical protein
MKTLLIVLAFAAAPACAQDRTTDLADKHLSQPPVDTHAAATAPERAVATSGTGEAESRNPDTKVLQREPDYREVTIPAGTVLPLELKTTVASDANHVEDPVHATTRRAVMVKGVEVIPAGTAVSGHVTTARRPGRVKGRAAIGVRFNQLDLPGDGGRMAIATAAVTRIAPATKKRDAAEIGVGAAGGAIIGGVLGGGKGAAKGAAVGGAGGTGVVLATRGKEVRLLAGAPLSVRLTAPLTIRVRMK